MLCNSYKWFFSILFFIFGYNFFTPNTFAQSVEHFAKNIRVGAHSNKTRFVLDVSANIEFRIFTLPDPYRVVIDLPEISWRLPGNVVTRNLKKPNSLIRNFRYGYFREGRSRIVLDTEKPVKIKSAFIIPPNRVKSFRVVIDLITTSRKDFLSKLNIPYSVALKDKSFPTIKLGTKRFATQKVAKENKFSADKAIRRRGFQEKTVIVIDPGHGGIDPGSTSGRVYEKHITLAAAKVIKKHLEKRGRYKVFLTRRKDRFVRLRKRIAIAKNYGAQLFISIHADAIKNKRIRGLSVYTLSERASDKEAAELARMENKSDIIAGADLSDNSAVVSVILISLAQRDTMNASSKFASVLVKHTRRVSKILSNDHRFAGFAVLKSPDIPSILIEMGFLSNKADERALLNPRYREQLARSIGNAVDEYFYKK